MTEAEWLACTDQAPMLEFLRGKASGRKLYLFTVARVRTLWPRLRDQRSRRVIEVKERYVDREATFDQWYAALREAREAMHTAGAADGQPARLAVVVAHAQDKTRAT